MSNVDDLLREFRADAPGPTEGAAERILKRARAAAPRAGNAAADPRTGAAGAAPARKRRWSPKLRWTVLPVGLAAAVILIIAFAPGRDGSGGAPTLLERAEAVIASPSRIVELSTTVRSVSTTGAVNPHRTINIRQWTLTGAGRAQQFRILISEGPLDKPPTDEDSTFLTDRNGRIVDQRTWKPLFVRARDDYDYPRGGGRGELEIGLPGELVQGPFTLVDRLVEAYRSNQIKPIGQTAGGDPRFRLDLGARSGCYRMEFVLDARTLLPRRIVNTSDSKPCGTGQPDQREVWTIGKARSLPATAANRRLLAIGDWPTARALQEVRDGDPKRIDRVPPVPKLAEG